MDSDYPYDILDLWILITYDILDLRILITPMIS
jgi:hypothetical protein